MRIKHNQLPLGLDLDEIANINRQVLAHKVDKSFLNAHQKTLVWEIRRKNKNRLAAAKCRKRKLEDITINSESKEELTADFIVSFWFLDDKESKPKSSFSLDDFTSKDLMPHSLSQ